MPTRATDLWRWVSCLPVLFDLMMALRSIETRNITLKTWPYLGQQGGIIFWLAEITGSGALLILCKLASRHKKSMEKAAAEGCRANSHRGAHVLHSATEVEVEIFGVKANLQICRLDFWFISLISRNSIFSEGIDFGLVNSSILGEPRSLECHYLLQIMADFSGWSWTNNMVA